MKLKHIFERVGGKKPLRLILFRNFGAWVVLNTVSHSCVGLMERSE